MRQGVGRLAAPLKNLGEAANGRQIVGRVDEDGMKLVLRLVEPVERQQCASEGDPGREIARMNSQPGATDLDRFFVLAGAPVLFRELRKGDRRRVLLDPAS